MKEAKMSSAISVPESAALMRQERPGWQKALRPLVRNRLVLAGMGLVIILFAMALLADIVAPYDPIKMNVVDGLKGPSPSHIFGTDRFGRDIFSRVLYGSRISLAVGLLSVAAAAFVGALLGLISGYFGGWTDNIISRMVDVLFSFPGLILAMAIAAMLGPGTNNAIIAIAIVYSPLFSRVVRGPVMAERHKEYVEAAHVIGAGSGRIIRLHILPNVISPLIVQISVSISFAILLESYLSYLGLGVQPPSPSWGTMINEGRSFLEVAPWISIFPGLTIVAAVLAFNILGDGLRDVLDPQSRQF